MLKEKRAGCGGMTEQYQVIIQSQLGPRKGTLMLCYHGSQVWGTLDLVGVLDPVQGTRAGDGTVRLTHAIRTAVSTLSCETVLKLEKGRLSGTTTARSCRMCWEGILIGSEPQESGKL